MGEFNLNRSQKELKVVNEFNTVPLRNFNATELDLLITIMTQMRDKGLELIEFNFSDLKTLSKYNKETAIKSFANDLDSTYQKLISLNIRIGDDREWTRFVLFTEYTINLDNQVIKIGTNPKFRHLINDYLDLNYTQIELEEFVNLKSSYSKNLYRFLKQYRLTGKAFFHIDEFRTKMDIPDSYKYGNIKQQVLNVAIKELTPLFKNLTLIEIKGKGKYKRKVVKLEFYFGQEKIKDFQSKRIESKKKTKSVKLADKDNRMSKEERQEVANKKMNEKIPLNRKDAKNIKNQTVDDILQKNQIDAEDL